MNNSTVHYASRMVLIQIGAHIVAFSATALLAPLLLLFGIALWTGVLTALAQTALASVLLSCLITILRLRSHRYALRALSLRSDSIEATSLRALDALPASTTLTFFLAGALASLLILLPDIRPPALDDGRTASLVVLAITLLTAVAIPHYVLARQATLRLVELSPIETTTALLNERRTNVERRIRRRILLGVAAPALLVGAGAVLLVHAHLRAFLEESRKTTAVTIARAVLDSEKHPLGSTADQDVVDAAREAGFSARLLDLSDLEAAHAAGVSMTREPDGKLSASVPLDEGLAVVTFSADLPFEAIALGTFAALLLTLVAAFSGLLFGQELSGDLSRAVKRVRALALQGDLRTSGKTNDDGEGAGRFLEVQKLGDAIETLTDRFRVFAEAQERALILRETAQRVRGLLFASVSHDLKSPLNSILGFTDLLAMEDLTDAQVESLNLIRTRGRELLGLIETILDAARVEAKQLTLARRPLAIEWLFPEAIRKAKDLTGEDLSEPIMEIDPGLPALLVDPTHGTRAISVILAHALRTTATDPHARAVRMFGRAADKDRIAIDIVYGSREGVSEIGALLGATPAPRPRGLILGLSLSRRVIELHGGEVLVDVLPDGRAVCSVLFPAAPPGPPSARPSERN